MGKKLYIYIRDGNYIEFDINCFIDIVHTGNTGNQILWYVMARVYSRCDSVEMGRMRGNCIGEFILAFLSVKRTSYHDFSVILVSRA